MNQGRIWCVVNPTVGLPLFIGGVAVTSLVVHASVMTHTTWMSNFFEGGAAKTASAETTIAPVASNVVKTSEGYVITVNVAPAAETLAGHLGRRPSPDEVDVYWRLVIELNRASLVDPDNPDLVMNGQVIELPPLG